jgi:amino acid permease
MVLSNERANDTVQAVGESTALLSADCERGTTGTCLQSHWNMMSAFYFSLRSLFSCTLDNTHTQGSSILGTVFNFTNSIVGAGAIGLGGAFAASGGLFSIVCIIFFAYLAKLSLDMVVNLSETTAFPGTTGSYERVGQVTFGKPGFVVVLVSKFVYSFGSMIVYIVIVDQTFASAMEHLFYGKVTKRKFTETDGSEWTLASLVDNDDLVTFLLSATVVLPLCLLRDITPLEKFSAVKILAVAFLVIIVLYLFVDGDVRLHEGTFYQHWFEIRGGCLER